MMETAMGTGRSGGRRRPPAILCTLLSLALSGAVRAGEGDRETQKLRERLTEREDETRVEEPFSVDVLGRALTLRGQFETVLDYADHIPLGAVPDHYGRLTFDAEVELEAFYSFGRPLSIFVQARLVMEEDLLDSSTPDPKSDYFARRGEMWVASEKVAGLPLTLEGGRLNFEDDRRWWWDEDLDAARATVDIGDFELSLAVAEELFTTRTDRGYVDPDYENVLRILFEGSWDFHEDHAVQLFGLYHDDHSGRHHVDDVVLLEREDPSDADLVWIGVRATGAFDFGTYGGLAYWFDLAGVSGRDRVHASEPISHEEAVIEEIVKQKVIGWGFDVGVTYALPVFLEPRLTLGYARGSGDARPRDRVDRGFRQTGIHANESAFGGVQSFKSYGRLLEPELSNLGILTAGIGCSLFDNSSLDLVFHDYRLARTAGGLGDGRLELETDGRHREVGQAFDLTLSIEEWTRVEFEVALSVFRAGEALRPDDGKWVVGGFVAVRIAF
ncbi:MAG: alginate export family protein [Candidatus Brocadiae bacterium]|nr:alginate export family protein [Candidatus Brocadiia bacterium]